VAFALHIKQMYSICLTLGLLVIPLMPTSSSRIFAQFGLPAPTVWPETGNEVKFISKLFSVLDNSTKPSPLYKKLTPEDIESFKQKLSQRLSH
jgi:methionyl-tRNA synthetase